jgi:hypothetical protein
MKRTSLRLGVTVWLIVLSSAGCKENRQYTISGKVTRGGEPLVWESDNSQLLVVFVPVDRSDDPLTYRAETNKAEGTYTVTGIPPGEYLVSIQQTDPIPTHDLLNFAYGPSNSPIRKEVNQNGQVIDIDIPLDRPGGGRRGGDGGKGRGRKMKEAKDEDAPD